MNARRSDSDAAVGFRVHSGWTAFVVLSLDGNKPRVLTRGRPQLVETFTYKFRQPYHTAETMPIDEARVFINQVTEEAKRLARTTIQTVRTNVRQQGYELACFSLILSSARPLPKLERILASHALIHTADGELFRVALAGEAKRCRLPEFSVKQSVLIESACKTFGLTVQNVMSRLTALGKPLGPPWSEDEKLAALAAWLALDLASRQHVSSPSS